jgi:hypothetical protein
MALKNALARRRALILTAIFIFASLAVLARHEMWRDELQAWLIAKDNASVGAVYEAGRYEKHPQAWLLALFFLSRLTGSPAAMQAFHLLIAALSVYLLLRYAPFGKLQKIQMIFGYYLFFEYNVISRNYALGILCLILFCVVYLNWREKPILWAAPVFVLANTSVYGLILALAIGVTVFVEIVATGHLRKKFSAYLALVLMAFGCFLSLVQLAPVSDSSYDRSAALHLSFNPGLVNDVLRLVPRAFFPIPKFIFNFWNTYLLDYLPSPLGVTLVLAALVLLFAAVLVRRDRAALLIYSLGTFGILAWSYIGRRGFTRHSGFLFMIFVASLWLAQANPRHPISKKGMSFALTVLLSVQTLAGGYAAAMDFFYPFSQAKAAAKYIKSNGYAELPVVGEMDFLMTPVSGYLGEKIYFLRGERWGSYVVWDLKRFRKVRPEQIIARAQKLAESEQKDCIIILSYILDGKYEVPGHFFQLTRTGGAIVRNETYTLYILKHTKI